MYLEQQQQQYDMSSNFPNLPEELENSPCNNSQYIGNKYVTPQMFKPALLRRFLSIIPPHSLYIYITCGLRSLVHLNWLLTSFLFTSSYFAFSGNLIAHPGAPTANMEYNAYSSLPENNVRHARFSENSPSIIERVSQHSMTYNDGSSYDSNNTMDTYDETYEPDNVHLSGASDIAMYLEYTQPNSLEGSDEQSAQIHSNSPNDESLFLPASDHEKQEFHDHPSMQLVNHVSNMTPSRFIRQQLSNANSTRTRTHGGNHASIPSHNRVTPSTNHSGINPPASRRSRSRSEPRNQYTRQACGGGIGRRSGSLKKAGRTPPEDDRENQLIKSLRANHNLNWGEIAQRLNQARLAQGKPASFTEAAVYGRFKRNAPLIARAEGDYDFNVNDYMQKHVRRPSGSGVGLATNSGHNYRAGPSDAQEDDYDSASGEMQFTGDDDTLLQDVYEEMVQGIWNMVSQRLRILTNKHFDPTACAERFEFLSGSG